MCHISKQVFRHGSAFPFHGGPIKALTLTTIRLCMPVKTQTTAVGFKNWEALEDTRYHEALMVGKCNILLANSA